MRVAILQRVCTTYRVPLFQKLTNEKDIDFLLFIGDNIPESKVRNASDLTGVNYRKLKSLFVKLRGHFFPIHTNLIKELKQYKPDVIICEGESNFFGYVQAIFYKFLFNKNTKLIHWCFIVLPGEDLSKKRVVAIIKSFFRKFFDAFLLYSSYSESRLLEMDRSLKGKTYVATNVGNVEKMLEAYQLNSLSKTDSRSGIKVKDRFTILYLGTLDRNKRPELMLELASLTELSNFNFIIAGYGPMYEFLEAQIAERNLTNVYLVGKVTTELYSYLNSTDLLIIPGRGGIVISEALAFGIPVLVYQADGTEYDLIKNGETGFILESDSINDFKKGILSFANISKDKLLEINLLCNNLVKTQYTSRNMINQIKKAVITVMSNKN